MSSSQIPFLEYWLCIARLVFLMSVIGQFWTEVVCTGYGEVMATGNMEDKKHIELKNSKH